MGLHRAVQCRPMPSHGAAYLDRYGTLLVGTKNDGCEHGIIPQGDPRS